MQLCHLTRVHQFQLHISVAVQQEWLPHDTCTQLLFVVRGYLICSQHSCLETLLHNLQAHLIRTANTEAHINIELLSVAYVQKVLELGTSYTPHT